MKKLLLSLIVLIFICNYSNAQYKFNKTKYDYRTYSYQVGDPYNPGVSGVCSFLIPGLGQMFAGEGGRGAAFLLSDLGFTIIYATGYVKATTSISLDSNSTDGAGLMVFGLVGMLVVDIWSIVDAVRVAKVNDLAFRDRSRVSINYKIRPFISSANDFGREKLISGVSFRVTF